MTTLPGPERIKELREMLFRLRYDFEGYHKGNCANDLLAILDALPALQAENEKLKAHNELLWTMESEAVKSATARAEKAEAELSHRCDQRDAALESVGLLSAELAAARPLLDEIKDAIEDELGLTLSSRRVWDAALAYRLSAERAPAGHEKETP